MHAGRQAIIFGGAFFVLGKTENTLQILARTRARLHGAWGSVGARLREKSASVVASLASYREMSVGDGRDEGGEGEGGSAVRDHKDAAGAQGQCSAGSSPVGRSPRLRALCQNA